MGGEGQIIPLMKGHVFHLPRCSQEMRKHTRCFKRGSSIQGTGLLGMGVKGPEGSLKDSLMYSPMAWERRESGGWFQSLEG